MITRLFAFILAFTPAATTIQPVEGPSASTIFDHLGGGAGVTQISLETDLNALLADKGAEAYQPALIRIQERDGGASEWLAEVRLRGKYRRRACDFPPLKIKFDKEDLGRQGLASFHTLKLVTHCLDDESASQEQIMREYLAYQMYRTLTDQSYRVQLVRITYIDSRKSREPLVRLGFLLESNKELAARLDATPLDTFGLNSESLDREAEHRMRLFQYMIGNTDWKIDMQRNLQLFQDNQTGAIFPVPYDFDFSGWVDAQYAKPDYSLGLEEVQQRYFMGPAPDPAVLPVLFNTFQAAQAEWHDRIDRVHLFSGSTKRFLHKYLDSFFERDFQRLERA